MYQNAALVGCGDIDARIAAERNPESSVVYLRHPHWIHTEALDRALSDILAVRTLDEAHDIAADVLGKPRVVRQAGPVVVPLPVRAKATKPAGMTAEAVYYDRIAASRAACAAHGDMWVIVPGASAWADIPGKLRSFKTRHGARVIMPYARIPAEKFWPHGLPAGVVMEPEGPRDTTPCPCFPGASDARNDPTYKAWLKAWSVSADGIREGARVIAEIAQQDRWRAEDKERNEWPVTSELAQLAAD